MTTANSTCYLPSGQTDPNSQSCNPNAAVSHCCWNSHVCLSNGLCWDTINNHIIRVTCTDASWTDSRCPQHCKDDPTTLYGDMRQCAESDTNWVCGVDASNCTNPFTVPVGYVDDNRAVSLSAILALPSAYSSATATGAANVTTITASPESSATSKSGNVMTAGLGAGLGVGLPLLAALLISLFVLRRTLRKLKTARQDDQAMRGQGQRLVDHSKWQREKEADSANVHEAPGNIYQAPENIYEAPDRRA